MPKNMDNLPRRLPKSNYDLAHIETPKIGSLPATPKPELQDPLEPASAA